MRRRPTRPLIDNGDGSLSIQLTRGMRAVIDAADAELASECNWQAFVCDRNPTPYAVGHPARRQKVYLHRWLLGLPPGSVDHIDGNGLNNRRCNLRVCSARENSMNLRRTRGEAVFKGVTFNQGAFRARIVVGGRSVFLGRFPTAIEAALAYDAAAVKHFGEFAATNASLGLLEQRAIDGGAGR